MFTVMKYRLNFSEADILEDRPKSVEVMYDEYYLNNNNNNNNDNNNEKR